MDRLFANLSPEELYEHLQSLDDGEKTIRVVGNTALLPSLGAVYKLRHSSHEAVWDAMRAHDHTCLSLRFGDSYCSNPFWSSCPHRMACAGCDFNLPKSSARAQALERKSSIGRYLESVPLTADERAIAEVDMEKLDRLIQKLDEVPTLDGRMPKEINKTKRRP